jgi:polygalacturonase
MMSYRIYKIVIAHFFILIQATLFAQDFNIEKFGAIGDGKTINTIAIQKAIDAASKAPKSGRVIVPNGRFLTGNILLKNGVDFHLDNNAVLLGSTNWYDYAPSSRNWRALIRCEKQQNISITGKGTIDGQGHILAENIVKLIKDGIIKDPNFSDHNYPNERLRPQIIELLDCNDVKIVDINLKNSSCWVQTYSNCTKLLLDKIKVESWAYWNNDGIDIVDCKEVVVKNCDINSADDGICIKSDNPTLKCENVSIYNCRVRSNTTAIKFGTASLGGFKNVTIDSIFVYDTFRTAVALEEVDGGTMEDIKITNIKAVNTGGAVFIRLGKRNKLGSVGIIKNVLIKNLQVDIPQFRPDQGYPYILLDRSAGYPFPSSIVGLPGEKVKNVVLENITINYSGVSLGKPFTDEKITAIPEQADKYPENHMFGKLPAWAFYVRHVDGLLFKNITLKATGQDTRHVMVFDDTQDLHIDNMIINSNVKNLSFLLNNVMKDSIVFSNQSEQVKIERTIYR